MQTAQLHMVTPLPLRWLKLIMDNAKSSPEDDPNPATLGSRPNPLYRTFRQSRTV